MNDVPPKYAVIAGTVPSDRDRAVAVWLAGGFGDPDADRQRARFDWLYGQCPHGEGQVNFLYPPGQTEPVGFLGVSLREWMLDGVPVRGGALVDFVVHPSHRSAAPALQLQRRGRERANESAKLLFGLPEPKAIAIFKRLGSTVQGSLARYARVVRYGAYLQRRMPAWLARPTGAIAGIADGVRLRARLLTSKLQGTWQQDFDASFDALWQRCDKRARCIGVRDQKLLRWRFGSQPHHQYRVFAVRSRSDATLRMYFVCERDGDTLVIKDLLAEGTDGFLTEGLFLLCLAARDAGASAISVQILADEFVVGALRRAGFVQREARPFFGMVGEPSGGIPAATWYITQADEDN